MHYVKLKPALAIDFPDMQGLSDEALQPLCVNHPFHDKAVAGPGKARIQGIRRGFETLMNRLQPQQQPQ